MEAHDLARADLVCKRIGAWGSRLVAASVHDGRWPDDSMNVASSAVLCGAAFRRVVVAVGLGYSDVPTSVRNGSCFGHVLALACWYGFVE